MTTRVAINGFGRIGRCVFRAIFENREKYKDLEIVAINDLSPLETNVHLLQFDSVHGRFDADVKIVDGGISVNGEKIAVVSERNVAELPWATHNVDVVMECTGIFRDEESAGKHLTAGAKKVIISAPAKGDVKTIVYGVNHEELKADDKIISNGSCTTNCLAPMAKILDREIGIVKGHMTTIHSYTNDQRMVDSVHSDLRRARAGAVSMIPTTTGAAKAVALVLPQLKGKLDGVAIRVPTPNVSLVDLTFVPARKTTVEEVKNMLVQAASGELKGIMGTEDRPLVSVDFMHCQNSSTVDLDQTKVIDGELVRVASWYDNEWGFSNRMADVALLWDKL